MIKFAIVFSCDLTEDQLAAIRQIQGSTSSIDVNVINEDLVVDFHAGESTLLTGFFKNGSQSYLFDSETEKLVYSTSEMQSLLDARDKLSAISSLLRKRRTRHPRK